jgi:hypothetical protein
MSAGEAETYAENRLCPRADRGWWSLMRIPDVKGRAAGDGLVASISLGGVEYGAIADGDQAGLTLAWRYRISRPGRWFVCGELIPYGRRFLVRGWDGQAIGSVGTVSAGLHTVSRFYAVR